MMEERIGKPCLGVVPYLENLSLDEEDSLGLPDSQSGDIQWSVSDNDRPLRIAVIAFPSLSNFTDFDALRSEPSVAVRFCRKARELRSADVVILPGSKQTSDDLLWMRREGLDVAVVEHARTGLIAGICGGMQMLGRRISDPDEIEGTEATEGLALLPIETTMRPSKITITGTGKLIARLLFAQPVNDVPLRGYEIHIGETSYLDHARPFAELTRKSKAHTENVLDGCVSLNSQVFGTYLHGLFDGDDFRRTFIAAARAFYNLAPAAELGNWEAKRQQSLDRLASAVRQALDIPKIFEWVGLQHQANPACGTGEAAL